MMKGKMIKKILIAIFVIGIIGYASIQGYKHFIPKKGKILRYENFRGHEVPIIANGKGGSYRWVGDVPWDVFTIEEKFDMARVHGGWLSDSDIEEIRQKYTKR